MNWKAFILLLQLTINNYYYYYYLLLLFSMVNKSIQHNRHCTTGSAKLTDMFNMHRQRLTCLQAQLTIARLRTCIATVAQACLKPGHREVVSLTGHAARL